MRAIGRTTIHSARLVLLIALVLAMVLSAVAPAFAWMEDDPKAVSATNPNDPADRAIEWRQGWGRTAYPQLTFTSVGGDPLPPPLSGTYPTLGFIYRVDRLPDSLPTTGDPVVDLSSDQTGGLFSHTFDLQGVLDEAPLGQWGYVAPPGQMLPVEGPWYVHVRFFNRVRVMDGAFHYRIGLDLTPPSPVAGLTSSASDSPTLTPVTTSSGTKLAPVIAHTRNRFVWQDLAYDALSGPGLFLVDVRGVDGTRTTTVPYVPTYGLPTAVTVENLTSGLNVFTIGILDKAGNKSAAVTTATVVDTDTPSIRILRPDAGSPSVRGISDMSATATDLAGLRRVVFAIDGSSVATLTSAPYTYRCDTSAFVEGSYHTLAVGATDLYGRVTTATQTFQVLQAPPSVAITSPSADKQKLRSVFRFTADASATAPATVSWVRFTVDKTAMATDTAAPYLYDLDTRKMSSGTHTMTVTVRDSAGRTANATRVFIVDQTPPPPDLSLVDRGMDATVTALSASNGGLLTDADGWYRRNWGHSVTPDIYFSGVPQDKYLPTGASLPTLGFIYRVDRLPNSYPSAGDPTVNMSSDAAGTLTSKVLDLRAVVASAPADQWGYTAMPGQVQPYEGQWYVHWRFFNEFRTQSNAHHALLNIDVTPPDKVTGFFSTTPDPANTFRRVFYWDSKDYDALSGVALFKVKVNGTVKALVPYLPWEGIGNSVTIEDMPLGTNKVEIRAVDRANNESPATTIDAFVDNDTPTVSIASPKAGSAVRGTYTFSATAKDAGGIDHVTFKVDGKTLKTVSTAPYATSYDTRLLSQTVSHKLTAEAVDKVGHTAKAEVSFSVDNTPIAITSLAGSPNPFYPRLRDGYKDDLWVTFKTNERSAALYLRAWSGSTLVRESRFLNVAAGSQKVRWDGKWKDGTIHEGKFSYQIVVTDAAGNVTSSAKLPVTIKFTELVQVAPNQWRVIQR